MTTRVLVKKNSEAVIPAHVIKSLGITPGTELEIDIRIPSTKKRDPISVDIPSDKTVQDFLDEFEYKYKMSSDEFYKKLQNGELDEDPELNESKYDRYNSFYKLRNYFLLCTAATWLYSHIDAAVSQPSSEGEGDTMKKNILWIPTVREDSFSLCCTIHF